MKIVIIHGQNHIGSTCTIARELAGKVGGDIREFFLPKDFAEPCLGCFTCFQKTIDDCPHAASLKPLREALLASELIILDSPVYVYHATGSMMNFLDHFGTWWIVHRPEPAMCGKQAVAVTTAAGGGMASAARDMADSLKMWGISRVYRLGVGVQAVSPDEIPAGIRQRIYRRTDRLAAMIRRRQGSRGMNCRARFWFSLMRLAHRHLPPAEPDYSYWEDQGWHGAKRPWREVR